MHIPHQPDRKAPSGRKAKGLRSRIVPAAAIVLAGAAPALLIASSARAAGATPADDWTIGLLALSFGSMLLLLTVFARHLARNLKASAARHDLNRRDM
ncbi:hypothetical protein [Stappia sp. ES.058]|uniref:hypothetical protein n=1 Tax=Stappia sp. ES.058 TaxID=1881061 RepID=UPI00087A7063|nr:hypothetical protein [Stappia sp. ES.058]SDU28511.1 hypothetical protein SAMN05428979_2741 [Stappia sp. ES.058]